MNPWDCFSTQLGHNFGPHLGQQLLLARGQLLLDDLLYNLAPLTCGGQFEVVAKEGIQGRGGKDGSDGSDGSDGNWQSDVSISAHRAPIAWVGHQLSILRRERAGVCLPARLRRLRDLLTEED